VNNDDDHWFSSSSASPSSLSVCDEAIVVSFVFFRRAFLLPLLLLPPPLLPLLLLSWFFPQWSASPRQITVKTIDWSAFANILVLKPLPNNPSQPSDATIIRIVSAYDRLCLAPMLCLVVFTTLNTLTTVSLTIDEQRPINALRMSLTGISSCSHKDDDRALKVVNPAMRIGSNQIVRQTELFNEREKDRSHPQKTNMDNVQENLIGQSPKRLDKVHRNHPLLLSSLGFESLVWSRPVVLSLLYQLASWLPE
jgi:hypothetical protein